MSALTSPSSPTPPYSFHDAFDMTKLTPLLDNITTFEINAEISPLLRLPIELRNKIFAQAIDRYEVQPIIIHQRPHFKRSFKIRCSGNDLSLKWRNLTSLPPSDPCALSNLYRTAMLSFTLNTFVFSHPDNSEKWLAQKDLRAKQNIIITIQCPVVSLFFKYNKSPIASQTFKYLEEPQYLILVIGKRDVSDEEKSCIAEKVWMANRKEELEVLFMVLQNDPRSRVF